MRQDQDTPLSIAEPTIPDCMLILLDDRGTDFMDQLVNGVLDGLKRRKGFITTVILRDHYKQPVDDAEKRDAIFKNVHRVIVEDRLEALYLGDPLKDGKHIATFEVRLRDNCGTTTFTEEIPYRIIPYMNVTTPEGVQLPSL